MGTAGMRACGQGYSTVTCVTTWAQGAAPIQSVSPAVLCFVLSSFIRQTLLKHLLGVIRCSQRWGDTGRVCPLRTCRLGETDKQVVTSLLTESGDMEGVTRDTEQCGWAFCRLSPQTGPEPDPFSPLHGHHSIRATVPSHWVTVTPSSLVSRLPFCPHSLSHVA